MEKVSEHIEYQPCGLPLASSGSMPEYGIIYGHTHCIRYKLEGSYVTSFMFLRRKKKTAQLAWDNSSDKLY